MSGRVFIAPQAGRPARNGSLPGDDEPWGTTASKAQFRPYGLAEASSSRGTFPNARLRSSHSVVGAGTDARSLLGRSALGSAARDDLSAVTELSASSVGAPLQGQPPAWAVSDRRPIPERPFLGNSVYREDQEKALNARNNYFPYRNEFHPRSKRLLYEMALAKCANDEGSSASGRSGSLSCFTVASKPAGALGAMGATATGSQAAGSAAGSAVGSRAASTPCLHSVASSPPAPADSRRVPGGIARRRREFQLKAPSMWPSDERWVRERYEKDGPAGLTGANFPSHAHSGSLASTSKSICLASSMLGWSHDAGPGKIGAGLM